MLEIPNKDGTYRNPDEVTPEPPEGTDPELSTEPESEPEPAPEPEPEPGPDLTAQLAEEREARIRLEERLKAREEPVQKAEEPKVFTRQQLRAAVNEGTIDEDQMEEIWSTQQRDQINRDLSKQLDERDQRRTTESFVATETEKYLAAHPGVKEVGSPEWKKVKDEYDFLVQMGDKDSKATELKALRAAFGKNVDRIPERTASRRETPSDTSGSQAGGGDRPVDLWNRVPKHLKPYYKDRVAQGFMTLEDVKKDIPYMSEKH